MSARVPMIAPRISTVPVQTSKPLSASMTWQQIGAIANYCAGHGGTLIPSYHPGNTITAGSSGSYSYYVFPTHAIITRMWIVRAHSADPNVDAEVTITAGGYSTTQVVPSHKAQAYPLVLFQHLEARYYGEIPPDTPVVSIPGNLPPDNIAIVINAELADIVVDRIACYEVPRDAMTLGQMFAESGYTIDLYPPQYGVEVDSLKGGAPVYAQEQDNTNEETDWLSLHGAAEAMRFYRMQNSPKSYPTRMLWCWAVPEADALTTTSSTAIPINILPLPYLAKRGYVKERTPSSTIRIYFHAKVDADTGLVGWRKGDRENIGSVAYTYTNVTHTAFNWYNDFWDTQDAMEDLDQPDGRFDDSGTPKWSELQAAFRKLSSTQVWIKGICVYDEDT
jgi:hypothetical protein